VQLFRDWDLRRTNKNPYVDFDLEYNKETKIWTKHGYSFGLTGANWNYLGFDIQIGRRLCGTDTGNDSRTMTATDVCNELKGKVDKAVANLSGLDKGTARNAGYQAAEAVLHDMISYDAGFHTTELLDYLARTKTPIRQPALWPDCAKRQWNLQWDKYQQDRACPTFAFAEGGMPVRGATNITNNACSIIAFLGAFTTIKPYMELLDNLWDSILDSGLINAAELESFTTDNNLKTTQQIEDEFTTLFPVSNYSTTKEVQDLAKLLDVSYCPTVSGPSAEYYGIVYRYALAVHTKQIQGYSSKILVFIRDKSAIRKKIEEDINKWKNLNSKVLDENIIMCLSDDGIVALKALMLELIVMRSYRLLDDPTLHCRENGWTTKMTMDLQRNLMALAVVMDSTAGAPADAPGSPNNVPRSPTIGGALDRFLCGASLTYYSSRKYHADFISTLKRALLFYRIYDALQTDNEHARQSGYKLKLTSLATFLKFMANETGRQRLPGPGEVGLKISKPGLTLQKAADPKRWETNQNLFVSEKMKHDIEELKDIEIEEKEDFGTLKLSPAARLLDTSILLPLTTPILEKSNKQQKKCPAIIDPPLTINLSQVIVTSHAQQPDEVEIEALVAEKSEENNILTAAGYIALNKTKAAPSNHVLHSFIECEQQGCGHHYTLAVKSINEKQLIYVNDDKKLKMIPIAGETASHRDKIMKIDMYYYLNQDT
jgi:hypothetical protein